MKRILVAFGAATMAVTALTAVPAGATSKVPSPKVTVISTVNVVCHAKGATIAKDGKTVRCPGGRVYRAGPSKKFIVVGTGDNAVVLEVDSNMTPVKLAGIPGTVGRNLARKPLFEPEPEWEPPADHGPKVIRKPLVVDPDTGQITECVIYWDGFEECITYGGPGDDGPPVNILPPITNPPVTTKPKPETKPDPTKSSRGLLTN